LLHLVDDLFELFFYYFANNALQNRTLSKHKNCHKLRLQDHKEYRDRQ